MELLKEGEAVAEAEGVGEGGEGIESEFGDGDMDWGGGDCILLWKNLLQIIK